jgi:hypothetical protein
MSTSDLVEWQRYSPEGIIEPWLTWPFMDEIHSWDLSKLIMLETGAGRSTRYWRSRCAWVDTIEANEEWAAQALLDCHAAGATNGRMIAQTVADGTEKGKQSYLEMLHHLPRYYDLIVVDGIYRVEAIEFAIRELETGKGGYIFIDNLDQDYVFISPKAMDLIQPFEQKIFIQPGHVNHEGKPWNTRWVKVPKLL